MKPMYALHKDSSGAILSAGSFSYDYELQPWLRTLDLRPGDRIEFGEAVKRADEPGEPFTPAFIAEPPPAAPEATAAAEQPF